MRATRSKATTPLRADTEQRQLTSRRRKRIRQLVSFAGATIILTTFMVKDAGRDKLREATELTSKAEADLESFEGAKAAIDASRDLKADTQITLEAVLHSRKYSQLDDCNSIAIVWQEFALAQNELREVSRLNSSLQTPVQALSPDQELNREDAALWTKVRPVASGCIQGKWNVAHPNKPTELQVVETEQQIHAFEVHLSAVIEVVVPKALDEVERLRQKAEQWTKLCYGLYALGWLVTVTGIFLGPPEEGSAVEKMMDA